PPDQGGEFVARMEGLLELYRRPYSERRPLVCVDEVPKQLVAEARAPVPPAPGRPARYGYEYRRCGVANAFLAFAPRPGRRRAKVTEGGGARDSADLLREPVEEIHEEAERVALVVDNLNTHGPGCLYEAFPPARARAIARKPEWHDTPVHGSWLDVAEVE